MRFRTPLVVVGLLALIALAADEALDARQVRQEQQAQSERARAQHEREEPIEQAGRAEGRNLRRLAESGAPLPEQRTALRAALERQGISPESIDGLFAHTVDGLTLRGSDEQRRSHLGGPAVLGSDERWPKNERTGVPMTLLAVVDLDEIRAPAPLPPAGQLVFYYDFSSAEFDPAAETEVRWFPPGADTREEAAPGHVEQFPRRSITATSVPIWGEGEHLANALRDRPDWDRLLASLDGISAELYGENQLLGASRDVQGPVLDEVGSAFAEYSNEQTRAPFSATELAGRGWTLLAQFQGDEHLPDMMFGDAGALYVAIPTVDLPVQRFDRAIGIMQSH